MRAFFSAIIILILGISLFSSRGCNVNKAEVNSTSLETLTEDQKPVISFEELENDLGNITEGEQLIAWFEYENSGNAPLLIQSVQAGCGCTVPKWNEAPIQPGDKESIKVIFNSRGKKGAQNIKITVNSNAENQIVILRLKGIVYEKN